MPNGTIALLNVTFVRLRFLQTRFVNVTANAIADRTYYFIIPNAHNNNIMFESIVIFKYFLVPLQL